MNARSVIAATTDLILTNANNRIANSVAGTNSEYAKLLMKAIAKSTSTAPKEVVTVKRFRPDGTITINTYEDGKLASQTRIKPHLVPVPDFSAPPNPDGSTPVKMEPRMNLVELLLM